MLPTYSDRLTAAERTAGFLSLLRLAPSKPVCAVALAALPASADIAPARYGDAPAVAHVRISPAGDRVLAIASGLGKRGVGVIDLGGGPPTVVLQPDPAQRHLDACDWASNDHLVCSTFVFRIIATARLTRGVESCVW